MIHGQKADWPADNSGGEKAADEIVAQIGADALGENFLRVGGEETLERDEDDDENRQPSGEAANRHKHRVELNGHDVEL